MAGSGMAQIRCVDLSFWRVDLVGLPDSLQIAIDPAEGCSWYYATMQRIDHVSGAISALFGYLPGSPSSRM
jgi:hypothetical protein